MHTLTMHTDLVERIAEITDTPTGIPDPLHDWTDLAKRDELVESMEENGWIGAPIVVLSEIQALTGAHRIAAAVKAGVDAPRVTVEDLCALYGLDWASIRAEWPDDTMSWYPAAASLRDRLPREVVEYLGYDVDGV